VQWCTAVQGGHFNAHKMLINISKALTVMVKFDYGIKKSVEHKYDTTITTAVAYQILVSG